MSSALVTIENLNKSYGRGPVLQSLNLTVNSGRIVGVMGPNGCGKTTLFKILTGLISDDHGTVTIDGQAPGVYTKSIVSYLPEKTYLSDWMRAKDALDMFRDFYADFDRQKAAEMLQRFRLMSGQIRYTSDMLKDIENTLKERDETQGPYYSTYPSFIDSYRLVSRMAERFSFEYTLFCITLVDGKGALLEGEMVQTTSEMLKNAIGESLRKGDLFTCYSPVQYLILLNGAGQEHVLAVCERVERSLKQWENGKKINFSHQILGLAP